VRVLLLLLAGCGRSFESAAPADLGAAPDAADDCPSGRNACGDCAPPQPEECNGRDDNCDGTVDEGCSLLWPRMSDAVAPIRLYQGAVIAVEVGPYGAYTSPDSYRYRLSYVPSPGADPQTLAETALTDGGIANESQRDPDFDGTWLVWRRAAYWDYNSANAILAMRLGDRQLQTVVPNAPSLSGLAVSGGRVVFADVPQGRDDGDIELYDLATGQQRTLTFPGVPESAPDISGDWVVYERRQAANADSDVRALHISDGALDGPSEGLDGSHVGPAIDGPHVVWTRQLAGPPATAEVWWYDLDTRERRKLGDGQNPRVDGTLTCWDGPDGVWVADSSNGRSGRVATAGARCDISGRRVAWLGHQGLTYRDLAENEP
jgi:hypothetical protein